MPRNTTEPLGEFLSEVAKESARQSREQHKRNQQQRNKDRPPHAREEWPQGPPVDFAKDTPDTSHEEDSMSFFGFLIPPLHPKPEIIRRYRIAVSISITVLFIIAGASYGFFEFVGVYGFARAESLKVKIEEATQPLELKINKQTLLLETVSRQLTDQLAAGTAAEIRSNTAKRCLEKSTVEREKTSREIDRLQDLYLDHKGFRYPAPTCAEL